MEIEHIGERIEELYEQWINGNLSDVVAALTYLEPGMRAPGARVAMLTMLLVQKMSERDRAVLSRMLRNQAG